MIVLSLFDGISCGMVALQKAGIKVERYYASEIDPYAISISKNRHPNIVHLGNVCDIQKYIFIPERFNLLIGGSPCQDLSVAKKDRQGLSGSRSCLFYEYVRLLRNENPKYFIFENVNSMTKENKDIITKELGVEPILIDASLVSAQSRPRLFWTNIPNVSIPQDKGIYLKDILENGDFTDRDKSYYIRATYYKNNTKEYFRYDKKQMVFTKPIKIGCIGKDSQANRIYDVNGKSICLSANGGGRGAKTGLYEIVKDFIRKLTPIECERLQGLPDNYTAQGVKLSSEGVYFMVDISKTQRYKCLGNAFNVDVVAHILSFIPKE